MIELKDIDCWFENLRNILFDIYVSLNNAKYLLEDKPEREKQQLKDSFFSYYPNQMRFIVIIHLCKILDDKDNQKLNIFKLFRRLENQKYNHHLLDKLKASDTIKGRSEMIAEISVLRSDFLDLENSMKKVSLERDEIYAHLDPNSELTNVSWADLEKLAGFSLRVFQTIFGCLYNTDFSRIKKSGPRIHRIIKTIASLKENSPYPRR